MTIRVINKICTLLMLAITLASCSTSHDDTAPEPVYNDGMPMHFTSSVATPVTRAANLLHDSHYESFGVWTWKLPSTAPATPQTTDWLSVMEHYRVGYNTQYFGDGRSENGWGYDHETGAYSSQILKYWDLSCKQYDFKGYAPFCGATGSEPHAAVDANNKLHFYNIVGHYAALNCVTAYPLSTDPEYDEKKNHVDWVYCYGKRTLSPIPDFGSGEKFDKDMAVNRPNGEYLGDAISKSSTVPLRFHHLLPKVIFRIHVYDPDHLDDEQLVKIGIDVKANTVTKDADVDVDADVEKYGNTGTTGTPDAEYMDHTSSTIPAEAAPQVVSFHKSKNTHYRDLSPSIVSTDGSGVVSYTKEGWMELPQYAPVFTISMMADDKPYSRTIDPAVDITFPEKWEPDHIYIYIIQFNVKSKTLDTTSYIEEWNEDFDDFELKDW